MINYILNMNIIDGEAILATLSIIGLYTVAKFITRFIKNEIKNARETKELCKEVDEFIENQK